MAPTFQSNTIQQYKSHRVLNKLKTKNIIRPYRERDNSQQRTQLTELTLKYN